MTLIPRQRITLLLFAAGLIFRLLYLFESGDNPFFQGLGLDARYYDIRAEEILNEGLIGNEAYFMGPLYPHLLAALYGIAGRNLLLVRLLQAIASALVPVLLYRLGVRLFRPTAALLAAIIAVLYGPFIFYIGSILYTTVAVTLLIWILDRLFENPRKRPYRQRFLTGLLFGLATVGKGNILLFLPFAAWIIVRGTENRPVGRWKQAAVFIAGFGLVIGLVTARNFAAGGDFVPLTSNGGINFYIGNGPESSGAYEKPKGLDVDNDPTGKGMLEKRLGRPLAPDEVSRIWRDRALDFIRANPGAEAALMARKTVFFFSTFEIPQIESYHFQKRYSMLLRALFIPFGLLMPLAMGALVIHRSARTYGLAFFVFAYAASIILFFVLTRYRLPLLPVIILLASVSIVRLVEAFRGGGVKGGAAILFVAAPVFIFCNTNFYNVSPSTGNAQSHYRLGIIYGREGRAEEAITEYRRSVELDPAYEKARLNLGELLAVRGRPEEAEAQFRAAINLDPDYSKAHLNLGALLYRSGSTDGRVHLERAVALNPEYGKAWLHLAAASLLDGKGGAGEAAARAVSLLPASDPARGAAVLLEVRIEEIMGIDRWRRSSGYGGALPMETKEATVREILRDRENIEGLYRSAASTGDPGALYLFGAYLFRREGYAEAGAFFNRAADVAPDLPYLRFALGLIYLRSNDPGLALAQFILETENNPSNVNAWKNGALLSAQIGQEREARRLAEEYIRLGGQPDESIRSILF